MGFWDSLSSAVSSAIDVVVSIVEAIIDLLTDASSEVDECFGTNAVGDPVEVCPNPEAPPAVADLTVLVTNKSNGQPIAGATVTLAGPQSLNSVTDKSGHAPFVAIRAGDYQVDVVAKSFKEGAGAASVVESTSNSTKIELKSKEPVNPQISPDKLVVLVKKAHTTPARQKITLRTDRPLTGSGTFTRSFATIKFFTAATDGSEITFNGTDNVFPGGKLGPGLDLFAEGATASAKLEDVKLELTLNSSDHPVGKPVEAKGTSVEVKLDICKTRTKKGKDPDQLSEDDKIKVGRVVQVQDGGNHAGRAKLIVRKAKPKDFPGTLVLKPIDPKVQLFSVEKAGAAEATPKELPNAGIDKKGSIFYAQGNTVSGALLDTGFQLGVKEVGDDGDKVLMTVAKFTKIEAVIKPTPSNSARPGIAAPAKHTYSSTSLDESFATNTPLVLMRNAQPDNALRVTVAPAGLKFAWAAIRNKDDHASLGSKTDLPTLTPNAGDSTKCVLNANQKGSFRVRPFIDCNGSGKYDPEADLSPSMPMNLVLANATRVRDKSKGNQSKLTHDLKPAAAPNRVSIRNGTWPGTHRNPTAADLRAAGMSMKLLADVTGGGADGRLGLDMVFGGFINDLRNVQVECAFVDNTVAPPTNHSLKNLYVSNPGSATGALGTKSMFVTGDPAPVPLAWPILDSGRGTSGKGADGATMTRSYPAIQANRPLGIRYDMRCLDSPGRGLRFAHPVNANAMMTSVKYRHQFTGYFVFWTNNTKVRTRSGDPADRVYSVISRLRWECVGDFTFTYPGGTPTMGGGGSHKVNWTSTKIDPIARAQNHSVEVRPPAGITAGFAWDAR